MDQNLNRYTDIDLENKQLTPIYGYWSHPLVSLEEASQPILPLVPQLDRYIKVAKENCIYPSEHKLTRDESAALYLYTMEWGKESFYRALNKALRSEDRSTLKPWFGYLKLFDTAFGKLPKMKKVVWRGVRKDVSKQFQDNQEVTWWSVNSCSSSVHVVKNFLDVNSTLFLIEAANGKDIAGLTNYPNEDEVLLGPGTRFRVIGDGLDHVGGLHIVHLQEISSQTDAEPASKKTPVTKTTRTRQLLEMACAKLTSAIQTDLPKSIKNAVSVNENMKKNEANKSLVCYPNGDRYDGTSKNGKKHGCGTYYFFNGDVYHGEWHDDQMHGQGTFTWLIGNRYEGNYKEGKMHGHGTFYFFSGEKYVGDWTNNMRNGHGVYSWPNGTFYEGAHKNNTFHGRGKQVLPDGQTRKGDWKNNVFVD